MGCDDTGTANSHCSPDDGGSTADSGGRKEGRAAARRELDSGRHKGSQRLAAVRKQQGISLVNMARRLGTDVASVVEQEQDTADLRLSTIYAWQKILEVPVAEL